MTDTSEQVTTLDIYTRLSASIAELRAKLRRGQQQMADWQGGQLAVSAVPGAGKSFGMAAAAAIAIARQYQAAAQGRTLTRRQLVVVTFTRSAAANIKAKIAQNLRNMGLPQTGFVVYTLHGLALNIASRHPELSGLDLENVTLITPNQSHRFVRMAVEKWIVAHPELYLRLLEGSQFDGEETERLRRQSVLRTEVLPDLTTTVVHEAKSSGLFPDDLLRLSENTDNPYKILRVAAGLYAQYETLMKANGFIDYDDMILAALRVLNHPHTRRGEQNQVLAVFEDEAQDSSPLQTQLLEALALDPNDEDIPPSIIRVGDPNQAINSTFTPADPIYFREFCERCQNIKRLATMDCAGRSTDMVIEAANYMLRWVNHYYDNQQKNTAPTAIFPTPFRNQIIRPVDPDDPQRNQGANPEPIGYGLELYTPRDIFHSVELIAQRVGELFADEPEKVSAAILVRENRQGRWLAEALAPVCKENNIILYDAGERDRHSHVPEEILALLQFCDRPHSPDNLKSALAVMVQRQLIPTQDLNALVIQPEDFLYPTPLSPTLPEPARIAARICRSLLRARMELPIYQLISFFALTLNYEQAELATADKLTERVNIQMAGNANMGNMLGVLGEIVSSERFEPVEDGNVEAKYTRTGQLTIITMHKAKGLDWDYVFIPFLHENLIPGKSWIPPQFQFLGNFTLSEVARAQIRAALHDSPHIPNIGEAWEQAKYLKIAEEYRLLYVAMTRAKRLLWMSAATKAPFSWGKPENLQDQQPCPVFPALKKRFPECVRNVGSIQSGGGEEKTKK